MLLMNLVCNGVLASINCWTGDHSMLFQIHAVSNEIGHYCYERGKPLSNQDEASFQTREEEEEDSKDGRVELCNFTPLRLLPPPPPTEMRKTRFLKVVIAQIWENSKLSPI